jgi:hypothetical protein
MIMDFYSITDEFVGGCALNKQEIDTDNVIHINHRLATGQQSKYYAIESTLSVLNFTKTSLKRYMH